MTLTLKPHFESDEWDERTVHSQKHGPDSTLTSLGKPDQLTALLHTHWCSAGDQNQDEHTEMGRVCWSSRSTETYNSLKHRQKSTRTQSGLVFSWCQEQMWGQLVSRHHPAAPLLTLHLLVSHQPVHHHWKQELDISLSVIPPPL